MSRVNEPQRISPPAAGTARPVERSVVLGPCEAVVIAQDLRRGKRYPGAGQQRELDQTCRAAVAVSKGMNPGDVQVGEDGVEYCRRNPVVFVLSEHRQAALLLQPSAQAIKKEFAIRTRSAAIVAHADGVGRDLAGNHPFLQMVLEAVEHLAVALRNPLRGELDPDPIRYRVRDFSTGVQNVVHFATQVVLRRRQGKSSLDHPVPNLFGAQRVALYRGGCLHPLDQIDRPHLLRGPRRQCGPGDLPAARHRLTQQCPETSRGRLPPRYTCGCTISMRTPSGPTTNEISMFSPSGLVNGRGSIVNSTPLALISSAAARRSGYCHPR